MKLEELNKWNERIKASEKHRDEKMFRSSHKRWMNWYSGVFPARLIPVNLTFAHARSLIPRIYLRDPKVSVNATRVESEFFALVLEELDNALIRRLKVKKYIKRAILTAFFKGSAILFVGYGSKWCPPGLFISHETGNKKAEYDTNVESEYPWVTCVDPKDFIVPSGVLELNEAPWVARRYFRRLEEVKADKRFKNVNKLGATFRSKETLAGQNEDLIRIYEIHDIQNERVSLVDFENETVIYEESDGLITDKGFPFVIFSFNERIDDIWGIPDMKILEPQQLELNDIRLQESKHRRASVVKLLYETGMFRESEVDKMTNEDVKAMVEVEDINRIKEFRTNIPTEFWREGEIVRADAREALGFSRNEFGEYEQKTARTATETNRVGRGSELRSDERRDIVVDALVELVEKVNSLIFRFWDTEDQVIKMAGPLGVPLWVRFSGRVLEGDYLYEIDPDSGIPETKEVRLEKAVQVYKYLRQDELVRPEEVVSLLLRELYGTKYSSLLRVSPMGGLEVNAQHLPQVYDAVNQEVQKNADLRGAMQAMQEQKGGVGKEGGRVETPKVQPVQ